MIKKTLITTIVGLMLSISISGSAWSVPNGSQNLRGMGGRIFLVEVEVISSLLGDELPVGTIFPNCYFFDNGGVWNDPSFPVLGTWMQHKPGAATSGI